MDSRLSLILLLVCGIIYSLAEEDASDKSVSSKVSSTKTKLAKTELGAKPAALLKKEGDLSAFEDVSISDLGISVPPEELNDTIKADYHFYYNSSFYSNPEDAKKFWINLNEARRSSVVRHEKLSDSYRQATTIELSFDFPFYGNPLRNVTIATGGFLYMGDYLHNWIAATQYVAPLMANFDTSLSLDSVIKYADNTTAFTVLWENVYIQNRKNDGAFTFQVTLFKNGDITFAYKDIPYQITNISDENHPVKIGLSDAYVLERQIFFVRRKTVYEYSRIHNIKLWNISNNTALYFTALPTCSSFRDCSSCLSSGDQLNLNCSWCDAVKRCSDGIDRQRQNWVANGCTVNKVTVCPAGEATTATPTTASAAGKTEVSIFTTKGIESSKSVPGKSTSSKSASDVYSVDQSTRSNEIFESGSEETAHLMHGEEGSISQGGISNGAIATIMVFLVAMVAVSVWIFYAYKYPQSSSGQFLIKYRPSQWTIKKEANFRNTDASRPF